MRLWPFHGGLRLNGHKTLSSEKPIAEAGVPPILILPLLQHIGDAPEPVVQVGDRVRKGQIIAQCHQGDCSVLMSTPIHASSSGTVIAIEPRPVPHPSGLQAPCIVIETDGQDEWTTLEPLLDYRAYPPATVRHHIAKAGIVGLGGAGFPSHIKLRATIDTLIINGAECEPYITCDDRLMREHPQAIINGVEILRHILGGVKHCLIAVEDNKPDSYTSLSAVAPDTITVVKVPTLYPTGGERQLIQILTGREIGRAHLPASAGIIVHNIETTRAVYRAVQQGRPLLSRVVTVTGDGVARPQNLEVLLGTPMHTLLEHCGCQPGIQQLIMGGPMMGFALPHDTLPVVKTTNCLLALCTPAKKSVSTPCIRCSACVDVCPAHLLPQQLYWYAKAKQFKRAEAYHLFDCIECGCCAYVCPAYLPLVDYYRYAKAEIRAGEREQQKADVARQRYEFRLFRLEREKVERTARHQQKRTALQRDQKAVITATLERAKAKKTQTNEKTQDE